MTYEEARDYFMMNPPKKAILRFNYPSGNPSTITFSDDGLSYTEYTDDRISKSKVLGELFNPNDNKIDSFKKAVVKLLFDIQMKEIIAEGDQPKVI